MKFQSLFIGMILSLLLVNQSNAMPISWDLGGVGLEGINVTPYGDPDNKTDLFREMTFYAETTVKQYDTDGDNAVSVSDKFKNNGTLYGNGLVPIRIDDEGLGSAGGWEMTGTMTNFAGYVSDVSDPDANGDTRIDFAYTSGQINLYADNKLNADHGARGTVDDTGFDDGVRIATFDLLYGVGHTFLSFDDPNGDVSNQGSGEFKFKASYLAQDFWFDENGDDLADIYGAYKPINWFISFADYNIDEPILTQPGPDGEFFTVDATHDGSIAFDAVPEPATMFLFGIGLLSLAGFGRKKIN